MEVLFGKFMVTVVTPPGLNLVLVLFGFLLRYRFYRTGLGFIYTGIISLYIFSMPLVSQPLITSLQSIGSLDVNELKASKAQAIVILGGGRYTNATEYEYKDTLSRFALERVRYGAYLQRKSRLPVLVSGGAVFGEAEPEALLMKRVLEEEFIGVVRWVEDNSRTTYQNAADSYAMLAKENITQIVLVTHATHMVRAKEAFEQAGFTVLPAPLGFVTESKRPWYQNIMPSAGGLNNTSRVFYEYIGRAWYWLRYYKARPS